MKYTVVAIYVQILANKVERFKRKYPNVSVTFSIGEPYIGFAQDERGFEYRARLVDIELNASFAIDGYEFCAELEMTPQGENIIRRNPSFTLEIPSIYRNRCICDHCKKNVDRIYTTLLQNVETKEFKQVGNQCVKDFCGIDLGSYARYISIIQSAREDLEEGISHDQCLFKTQDVVEQCMSDINNHGFRSTKMGDSTASRARKILLKETERDKFGNDKIAIPMYEISNSTRELATECIKFWKARNTTDEFANNCKLLMMEEYTNVDNFGILCAAINSFLKVKDSLLGLQSSSFVGNVGEKVSISDAKISACGGYYTEFGYTHIYRVINNGNVYVWKTQKELGLDMDKEYSIIGTIKGHKEYNGIKQTELTRCKVSMGV